MNLDRIIAIVHEREIDISSVSRYKVEAIAEAAYQQYCEEFAPHVEIGRFINDDSRSKKVSEIKQRINREYREKWHEEHPQTCSTSPAGPAASGLVGTDGIQEAK